MRERILKNQVVLFGRFNFPPVPDVTVSLLQAFAAHGFMPAVIQQIDQNGQAEPRISLNNAAHSQIVFSNDRIDFFQNVPAASKNLDDFLSLVGQYIGCLHSRNLQFNRIAIVTDSLVTDLSSDVREEVRARFVPNAPVGAAEWTFKWAKVFNDEPMAMNILFEIARLQGVIQEPNRVEHFDGFKIMHDISTPPDVIAFRYNSENVLQALRLIKERIDCQISLNNIFAG